MPNQATETPTMNAKSFALPVLAAAIGIVYVVAGIIGGSPGFAVFGALVMFGLAAVLLLVRRRSETVRGLMDRRDERINAIDLRATAITGGVVIVAILVGFVVEIARGESGQPYAWLGFIAGVTYTASLVWMRVRG